MKLEIHIQEPEEFYIYFIDDSVNYHRNICEELQINEEECKSVIEKIGGDHFFGVFNNNILYHNFPTKKQAQQFVDYLEPYLVMKKLTM
jgi:hypothetical protein